MPATILSIQRFTLFRVSQCCFNSEGSKLPLTAFESYTVEAN